MRIEYATTASVVLGRQLADEGPGFDLFKMTVRRHYCVTFKSARLLGVFGRKSLLGVS